MRACEMAIWRAHLDAQHVDVTRDELASELEVVVERELACARKQPRGAGGGQSSSACPQRGAASEFEPASNLPLLGSEMSPVYEIAASTTPPGPAAVLAAMEELLPVGTPPATVWLPQR